MDDDLQLVVNAALDALANLREDDAEVLCVGVMIAARFPDGSIQMIQAGHHFTP